MKLSSEQHRCFPLTAQQKGLWFEYKMNPNSINYNWYSHHEIKGLLNEQRFFQALKESMKTFDIFRIRFIEENGEVFQLVSEIPQEDIFFFRDLTDTQLSEATRKEQAKALLIEKSLQPYDLDHVSPTRLICIKVSSELFYFGFCFHHITGDAATGSIYYQFLTDLYNCSDDSLVSYQSIGLKEYFEVLNREESYSEEAKNKSIAYWKEELKERNLQVNFPKTQNGDLLKKKETKGFFFHFDHAIYQQIKSFCNKNKTTPFLFISTCFGGLIYRYWNYQSFLMSYPVNIRPRGFQQSLGFYVSNFPMRFDLEQNMSLAELITKITHQRQKDKKYQNIVFPELGPHLRAESKNLDVNINLSVASSLLSYDLALEKLEVTNLNVCVGGPENDLSLITDFHSDRLESLFEYSASLFSENFIQNFSSHFKKFISLVLENPNTKISEISFLSDKEKQKILLEWNNTQTDYPQEKTIHQLFEEQAIKTPDIVAVIHEEKELTYKELNEQANGLAKSLDQIKSGDVVAVILERTPLLLVSMLALFKRGAVYLPIHPDNPTERIRFLIQDSASKLILTDRQHRQDFEDLPCHIVEYLYCKEPFPLNIFQSSTDIAYILYTSGTTGLPKGVMVSHRSLINITSWYHQQFPLMTGERVLQFANQVFDPFFCETLPTLTQGATLCMISDAIKMDALDLQQFILNHGIKICDVPTALAKILLCLNWPEKCSLKYFKVGGEQITWSIPQKLPFDIWNMYGTTETTIDSLCARIYVAHSPVKEHAKINYPIGKPISNTMAYILDCFLEPVPVGVTGELYIGGVGVAKGYLNRADLTAERFIANHFRTEEEKIQGENSRLYKTGDLCYWLEDGKIEYVSRCDDQIKIRGFRIELGEIETALLKHPKIKEVVVIAREDIPGDKRLVAYLVSKNKEDEVIEVAELRAHLQGFLPAYMIPAAFVAMETIPLTHNGKVDRQQLPLPEYLGNEKGYVGPRTAIEQSLCEIWQSVLKIEKIGIHDNFFHVGGDSIISIQVVAKARQRGICFSVRDLFSYSTVAELARVVKKEECTLTIKPDQGNVSGKVDLTPIQHWFFEQNFVDKHHFNQAILLEAKQRIDLNLLNKTLALLVEYHDALRLRFFEDQQGWNQEYCQKIDAEICEMGELSNVKDLDEAIDKESTCVQQNLNIEKGPVIKAKLFECGNGRNQRLVIAIHHLMVDGVSWRILLEDLERIYGQLAGGLKPTQLLKTHSYQQWAKIIEEYAFSPELAKEIPYWEKIAEHIILMPADYDNGKEERPNISSLKISLTEQETNALLTQVSQTYRTQINDILLTALTLAVGDLTGKYELSLYLEGHGREEIIQGLDLSRTVGWFTSLFPVHLEVYPNHRSAQTPGLIDLGVAIKNVKETLRQIPCKGIGYGILKYLRRVKFTKALFPNLVFNYLGQLDKALNGKEIFVFGKESPGQCVSPKNHSPKCIEINSEIKEGIFQAYLSYSNHYYDVITIKNFAYEFRNRLQQLINHCIKGEHFGYTPSDFPLISLDQKSLDESFGTLANIEDVYPLSSMQAGLLFHALYTPESDAYFVQNVLELEGSLDIKALRTAWQKVSNMHSILRTGLFWINLEQPLQYVLKSVEVPFEIKDWRGLREAECRQKLEDFIQEDRKRGFNLNQAPLLRLTLIQRAENHYTLVWSEHHVLTDGWCLPIILGDVFKAYKAFRQGTDANFPARRPYRDFIAWQQQQNISRAAAFWKAYLNTVEEPTRLSFKNRIKGNKEKEYETYAFALSVDETEKVQQFAKDHGLTINTVIQGALGVLLRIYAQKDEVVYGMTVSGRSIDLPGIEEMVGLFINTLPMKISIKGDEDNLSFLRTLQEQTQKVDEYCYPSLAQIQSWVGISEGMFDVLYVFENYPLDETVDWSELGLNIKSKKGIERTEYPLSIVAYLAGQLQLRFGYQTEHFDQDVIGRMSEHLRMAFKILVETPAGRVRDIAILTEREKQQILIEWNHTRDYPKDKTVHQLFEEQVEKTPDNIAVVFGQEHLTYQELNKKANLLAHYLKEKGVKPDVLVAIVCERSLDMMIGILGILKAGGAYVPIDPTYPPGRIQYILEDTNVTVILTQQNVLKRLPMMRAEVFLLDRDQKKLINFPTFNPYSITQPHHLAYVIYTSGSTGNPKGTLIPHSNVHRLFTSTQDWYHFTDEDVWTLFHSYAFDFSVWEIWGALFYGGRLVIVPHTMTRSPKDFYQLLIANKVTILNQTPSAFYQLIDYEESLTQKGTFNLREVIFGGETLNLQKLIPWFKTHGDMIPRLVNMYGITETTVFVTYAPICLQHLEFANRSYIGCPIPDLNVYILDSFLNPVPIGIVGELYIGGEGLARGYLNQPELTEKRFIENPFQTEEEKQKCRNTRLYKTGDLCCWLEDGNIEYLGRCDDQVKIRGFRIELGEIESALLKQPQIKEAVAIAREDTPGDKRLVGYVVFKDQERGVIDIPELRAHLQTMLPDYMIPALVSLQEIPLTANGKVNRKRLPAPDYQADENAYVAPRNKLEEILCHIWGEILALPFDKISVRANFFSLGGHSLIILKLVNKIKSITNIELKPINIFEYPTIAQMSEIMAIKNCELNEYSTNNLVDFTKLHSSVLPAVFFFHGVGGNLVSYYPLIYQLRESFNRKELPVEIFGLEASGLNPGEEPFVSGNQMINTYYHRVKEIILNRPCILIGWSYGAITAFAVAQELIKENFEIRGLISIDAASLKSINKELDKTLKHRNESSESKILEKLDDDMRCSTTTNPNLSPQFRFYNTLGFPNSDDIETVNRLNKVAIKNMINISDLTFNSCKIPETVFIKASLSAQDDNLIDWAKIINGPIDTYTIEGDHYSIMKSNQLVDVLSRYLLKWITS